MRKTRVVVPAVDDAPWSDLLVEALADMLAVTLVAAPATAVACSTTRLNWCIESVHCRRL